MNPSSDKVSKWMDILEWYISCSSTVDHLAYLHEQKEYKLGEEGLNTLELAKTNAEIDALVFRGYNLIYLFYSSSTNRNGFKIAFNDDDNSLFAKSFDEKNDMKDINRKLSHEDLHQSSAIISRIIRYDESLLSKSVFFKLQLFLWKTIPSHIMACAMDTKLKECHIMQPTIENALAALSKLGTLPISMTDLSNCDFFVKSIYSSRILPLQSLITEASEAQNMSFALLSSLDHDTCELSKESIETALDQVRSMRNKIRSINIYGLKINSICISSLERRYRDLNWLLKAEPIHTYQSLEKVDRRVRLQQLLLLVEKAPSLCKQRGEDSESLLNNKLKTIYNELMRMSKDSLRWLDDVKGFLPPSAAKGKTQRSVNSVYRSYDGFENFAVVNEKVLYNLLHSNILKFVEIDEEISLRESYRRTQELRHGMHEIFRVDRLGNDVDRTTLPEQESLLGLDGTFYFKKVTGSLEYRELNEKIKSISCLAKDLPVKTLEKITYDWIYEVLRWTEIFSSCLQHPKEYSLFDKISISSKDAALLVENAQDLFFHGLTDDIKKYLSEYKVSISPRTTSRRVHVKNNKGGSMHSMGGMVLRWIAFLFNALQQDLTQSLHWSKLTSGHLIKHSSPENESNLDALLNQFYDLVVVPDDDVIQQLLNRLGVDERLEKKACESHPVFLHRLLNHVSED